MTITKQQHKKAHTIVSEIANKPLPSDIIQAAKYRDQVWQKHNINLTKSMDLYSTTPDTAKMCTQTMLDVMYDNPSEYKFVEPSAGTGVFLEFLPSNTIAFDILPQHLSVQRQEFLTWLPPLETEKYAVVGAPPLGVYSDVSVAFINHALQFAVVVGMIVRRHIGERQIQSGRKLGSVRLDKGAVTDMTGGSTKYEMEFRVWEKEVEI